MQRVGILLKVNDILVGVAEEGVTQLTLCQWLQVPQFVVVTSHRKGLGAVIAGDGFDGDDGSDCDCDCVLL